MPEMMETQIILSKEILIIVNTLRSEDIRVCVQL